MQDTRAVKATWSDTQQETFLSSRANVIARNAVVSSGINAAARNSSTMRSYHDTFSVSRKRVGKITNQRHSGRCWMYSAFNVLRASTMELLDIDNFEFSQAFGMFYDKLEKANSSLERVIELADRPCDDRALEYVLTEGIGDGGYYPFAMNLVSKWGLVPASAMPETTSSKDSTQMNARLGRLIRKDTGKLRKMYAAGATHDELEAAKATMLEAVWRLLAICLGEPPTNFDLEISVGKKAQVDPTKIIEQQGAPIPDNIEDKDDKDKEPRRILKDPHITPQEFVERYVGFDPEDYVELVSIPGATRPFGHIYHLRYTDSVLGARPTHMLNVAPEVLDQAAIASLRAGIPCEMACDVMQDFPRGDEDFGGILATNTMDYEGLFDVSFTMDRADMYDLHESQLTHAMCFQGVELDSKKVPVAWRVENSWGDKSCKDGYLVVSADWFHLYGGEVVVQRKFVPDEVLKLYDTAVAEEVDPWSGFGCAVPPQD
jgi:bleomycin hydrolase